jgi:hypothetical protein
MAESKVPFDHMHGAARKNAIINGDMRIAQRGTSFAAIAHGSYSLDRWKYGKSGTMVHTITQDSSVPDDQFSYSLKFDVTTADVSIAAGDYIQLFQAVEGYNFKRFVGQTAALSFWIKAGKTGTLCVAFRNSVADRSYVSEVTIDSANTWEWKTVTLDFDYSGGTWDYTNGVGLYVNFALAAGSTYQTTADAWQSGNYIATSNQTNFVDNTDATCDVYVTGVQLELGDQATDFEFLRLQDELLACQRYYWKNTAYIMPGYNGSASGRYSVVLPTTMRASPSFSYDGTFTVATTSTSGKAISSVSLANFYDDRLVLSAVPSTSFSPEAVSCLRNGGNKEYDAEL